MLHTKVYKGNYLNCQGDHITQSVMRETKRHKVNKLPVYNNSCNFEGYDSQKLMLQTKKLRNLITKRGTFEMLIPLCCTTNPVRYKQFRELMKGIALLHNSFKQSIFILFYLSDSYALKQVV